MTGDFCCLKPRFETQRIVQCSNAGAWTTSGRMSRQPQQSFWALAVFPSSICLVGGECRWETPTGECGSPITVRSATLANYNRTSAPGVFVPV